MMSLTSRVKLLSESNPRPLFWLKLISAFENEFIRAELTVSPLYVKSPFEAMLITPLNPPELVFA